jgi:hypothetical protein
LKRKANDAKVKLYLQINDASNANEFQLSKGTIEFQNVCFSYGPRSVIKDVSFRVESGQRVALVMLSNVLCNLITIYNRLDRQDQVKAHCYVCCSASTTYKVEKYYVIIKTYES